MTLGRFDAPPAERSLSRRCVHCGYDLRASPAGLCPECGHAISELADSAIPWVHRKAIGRWRAAWRTVWIASAHPRVLVDAAQIPIAYGDAQQFRRAVILWLWLWGCAAMAAVYVVVFHHGITAPLFDPTSVGSRGFSFELLFAAGCLLPPVPMFGWLISLMLGTTSAGFFTRPADAPLWLRNRAVALTRYTTAPLAALPLAMVPLTIFGFLMASGVSPGSFWLSFLSLLTGGLTLFACIGLYVVGTLRVSAGVLQCGVGRIVGTFFGMAALWTGAALLGLGLFPMLMGYGLVVLGSLR